MRTHWHQFRHLGGFVTFFGGIGIIWTIFGGLSIIPQCHPNKLQKKGFSETCKKSEFNPHSFSHTYWTTVLYKKIASGRGGGCCSTRLRLTNAYGGRDELPRLVPTAGNFPDTRQVCRHQGPPTFTLTRHASFRQIGKQSTGLEVNFPYVFRTGLPFIASFQKVSNLTVWGRSPRGQGFAKTMR